MDSLTRDHAINVLGDYLRPIKQFLADPDVQEIMVNGPDDVWVERGGIVDRHDIRLTEVDIRSAIEVMGRLVDKDAHVGSGNAIIDARLPGLRIAAALHPVAVKGPSISIRKHNPRILALEEYVRSASMPGYVMAQIVEAINDHKNILVAGSTSSGKTTFLNAMIAKISPAERVLTIEDTQELKVAAPDWVSFEANEQMGVTIRALVKLALRYRPDRIIVGEVRGPEAFDLMQALNTGHDGGFATIHANSAKSALTRLETCVLTTPDVDWPLDAVRMQIANTFNMIIQLGRPNNIRRLLEVIRVIGYDHDRRDYITETLYSYSPPKAKAA